MKWTKHWKLLTVIGLAILVLVVVVASVLVVTLGTHMNNNTSTLRELAAKLGIHVGSAVDYAALTSDTQYAQILGEQFSAFTPENEMKWVSVEPQQGVYTFEQADAEVQFAQQHQQLVRGHNLVWHSQLPGWLTGGTFTNEQLADILKQHVTTEVEHFKGKIWQWDVVNEPLDRKST